MFLICGLGNMGMNHKKYLDYLDIDWCYYDPKVEYPKSIRLNDLREHDYSGITHVIISSNEDCHYDNYVQIRSSGFRGPVLVEKPAVLEMSHFDIFDDPFVSVGFVERYNPSVGVLLKHICIDDVISVDFFRCSVSSVSNQRIDSYSDVGIHDIDLYFYLFGQTFPNDHYFSKCQNTYTLTLNSGFISRFIWSNETSFKERKIIVRHKDYTLIADLIDQTVIKQTSDNCGRVITESLYVEKASPLFLQLRDFYYSGTTFKGRMSHEYYLSLKNMD